MQEDRPRAAYRAGLHERLHHHGVSGRTHLHLGQTRENTPVSAAVSTERKLSKRDSGIAQASFPHSQFLCLHPEPVHHSIMIHPSTVSPPNHTLELELHTNVNTARDHDALLRRTTALSCRQTVQKPCWLHTPQTPRPFYFLFIYLIIESSIVHIQTIL